MQNINLISISGRIGSGKDTVAKMMQYKLGYCKRFPNNTRSFSDWSEKCGTDGEWQIKKFAGALKQIASILTGIPVEKFEDQEFKKSLLGSEWSIKDWLDWDSDRFEMKELSVREFLQKLGTDGLRNGLHENVWVNALFADYRPIAFKIHSGKFDQENCYSHSSCCACKKPFYGFKQQFICKDCYDKSYPVHPQWIITDTRFPNELKSVKDRGGFTIRLTRNSDVHSDHISETALDEAEFDYVIDNKDQTLEETFCSVVKMIDKFKIE